MMSRNSSRRWPRWIMGVLGALLIFLLSVMSTRGEDPRGAWYSTAFQAINLEPVPMPIEARFLALDGTTAYTLTDTLPPGQARFYEPLTMDPPLPATFSGTLAIDAPGQVALEVLHLSETITGGNAILEAVADEHLGHFGYVPINRCVQLSVHNLATVTAAMNLTVFDLNGNAVVSLPDVLLPEETSNIILMMVIPPGFVGSGIVDADQPIEVTVRWTCDGDGSFVAAPVGATTLFAPFIPVNQAGLVTTTLAIQNTSSSAATGEIIFSNGITQPFSLVPLGGMVIPSPFANTAGSAVIRGDFPLAASVVMQSQEGGQEGALTYRAIGLEEAASAIALPVILSGYKGWATGDHLWVQNVGAETTIVTIRYVTVPTGTLAWQDITVAPGEVRQVTVPALPAQQAGAILLADQPLVVLAGAFHADGYLADRWLLYRGVSYDFACEPVTGVDFDWTPPAPTVSQTITFTATAWAGQDAWVTTTVDGAGQVGDYSSLALDTLPDRTGDGHPHISYHADGNLDYAYNDGSGWITEVVHLAGDAGAPSSLALDADGHPHISYHADGNLNYAYNDGSGWITEVVYLPGDAGIYNSLALDGDGHPHISFYVNTDLMYASHNGVSWTVELVDGFGFVGHYNSLALDAAGNPHISYCDWNAADLKYAHLSGSWISETVDSVDSVCMYSSLALDAAGNPHISYYDETNRDLKYAYVDGGIWISETVDGPDWVGRWTSLALDTGGRPHIGYWDETHQALRYAWHDGTTWHIETVDGVGDWGIVGGTSLALNAADQPRVSYHERTNGDLRFAWFRALATAPISYTWDLGDGATAEGESISHTYDLPSAYTVALTATNCLGFGVATATHSLLVTTICEPVHNVGFSWLPITPTVGQEATFTAQATGTLPFTYTWDLGDGSGTVVVTATIVYHTYTTTGVYSAALTVENPCGEQTVRHTVTIASRGTYIYLPVVFQGHSRSDFTLKETGMSNDLPE